MAELGARKVLRLTNKECELVPKAESALREIFARYDVDVDGALNDEELDTFAMKCNGRDTGFDAVEKEEIKENFELTEEGFLTLNGFLQLYQLQTMSDPDETWKDLKTHGYNECLELVIPSPTTKDADVSDASLPHNDEPSQ